MTDRRGSREQDEKDKGTRVPPKVEYENYTEQIKIGIPARNLTEGELKAWIEHFRRISYKLREAQREIVAREKGFEQRKWRWAGVIRGLKRTVDWQASVLGVEKPGIPLAIEKARELFRFTPEFEPDYIRKAKKRDKEDSGEPYPFFTEGFLYESIGKEDARTVLALVRELAQALGMDGHFLHGEAEEGQKEVWDELEGEVRRGE